MSYLETFLEKMSQTFGSILPGVIGALLILILGLIVAYIIKNIISGTLKKIGIDKLIKNENFIPSKFISKLIYFILVIMVFILTLEHLGISQVLAPVREMLSEFFGIIPNLIAVAIIVYVGYLLARIVSELVEMSGNTIRSFMPKLLLPESINIVEILKKLVFIFIFIPVLIIAFEQLQIAAISDPATDMLAKFIGAIPKIILATLILLITVIGGKMLVSLLKSLLESLKVNDIAERMNLSAVMGKADIIKTISNIVYAFIIIIGLITAFEQLEFTMLSEMINVVLVYATNILFGLVIILIGNWLSTLAAKNIAKKETDKFLASVIRVSVMAIFLAVGLNAMGIANDIINLAFGITLATISLTIILSLGLGGREAGGKLMNKILDKFK